MNVLGTGKNDLKFILHQSFSSPLFSPISNYVSWKLENNWDDYNELYHAVNYIENLKQTAGVWFDIHTLERKGSIIGVLTVVGGELEKLGIEGEADLKETVLLKYFHIVEKGMGHGSYWLNTIIFPYYSSKDYAKMLISSSHPKSFNFYNKLGKEVKHYTKRSDNNLHERICKTFLINL
ncbi:hypothetical protein ACFSYG_11420 [Leeuwenhoekiella polynyae]|uniref:N-acetyltransferase domain-containing protein n=1 Tax=Leeuwenhoekiella polynyae TaxID=1550906 RepID=A0A4Q0NWL0_9FLAO|nr:hypothetical protein [Leeuwenhoekiella polynyae]RXG15772.1 hypothetical protein DSM02_3314 [Leeuwenhoekiella polynyae]|tara:strand:+ start:47 stop:583 length:537 start_codon:yes stop_codon:yes gene_type:complete